jgi:hypothetical protein
LEDEEEDEREDEEEDEDEEVEEGDTDKRGPFSSEYVAKFLEKCCNWSLSPVLCFLVRLYATAVAAAGAAAGLFESDFRDMNSMMVIYFTNFHSGGLPLFSQDRNQK